jgi:N-acyl-L-homoserine lactone synthetase
LELKIAEKDELESTFRLRYKIYKEMGWINPSEYESECEYDEYDKHSKHFIINDFDGKNIVGTVRLIYSSDGRKLPVQKEFGIEIPQSGIKGFEISRLIINKNYRGIKALAEILGLIYEFALSEGMTHSYAIMEERFIRVLNNMGYKFIVIAGGKLFCTQYKVPVLYTLPIYINK